jgi:AbrB family looped-hinge helix DNA binding protein
MEGFVSRVTVSSKYQVVIPKDVRDRLKIRPGQKVEAFAIGERIELVPVRPIRDLRGILRGVEARFEREPDRDL